MGLSITLAKETRNNPSNRSLKLRWLRALTFLSVQVIIALFVYECVLLRFESFERTNWCHRRTGSRINLLICLFALCDLILPVRLRLPGRQELLLIAILIASSLNLSVATLERSCLYSFVRLANCISLKLVSSTLDWALVYTSTSNRLTEWCSRSLFPFDYTNQALIHCMSQLARRRRSCCDLIQLDWHWNLDLLRQWNNVGASDLGKQVKVVRANRGADEAQTLSNWVQTWTDRSREI